MPFYLRHYFEADEFLACSYVANATGSESTLKAMERLAAGLLYKVAWLDHSHHPCCSARARIVSRLMTAATAARTLACPRRD